MRAPFARATAQGIAALGLLALLTLSVAHAAPVVEIRARTEIVLEPVRRTPDGALVQGRVVDKFSREPMDGVEVTVRMDGVPATVRTNHGGMFEVAFRVDDGRHDIAVDFAGTSTLAPSAHEQSGVDVSKESLGLSIEPGDLDYSKRTVEVMISARSAWGGAVITADLFAGPASGKLSSIGKITTDSEGRGTMNIDREMLGGPGRKRVRVVFLGNAAYNPAEAESELLLATDTSITISVEAPRIAYEDSLVATGRVVDEAGLGVAREPVALASGARRLAATLTDAKGNFRLRASGGELGPGPGNVQAIFDPDKPWHRRSRSDLVQVEVAQPQPVPVTYTLAAFGATAVAMLAFLGLRTRPWEAWLARLRIASPSPAQDHQPSSEQAPPIQPGLQPARPGLVSTLRRPNAYDFSGTVHDAVTGRSIPGCVITLRHQHADGTSAGDTSQEVGAHGEFYWAELGAGEWDGQAVVHGYVTERFGVTIPHRGELRGARIELLPVRERIFGMYREVAESLLPAANLWGIWTPRQIFEHVRAQRPASTLARLTDFVEETYFSQRVPGEDILEQAQALANAARTKLGTSPSESHNGRPGRPGGKEAS